MKKIGLVVITSVMLLVGIVAVDYNNNRIEHINDQLANNPSAAGGERIFGEINNTRNNNGSTTTGFRTTTTTTVYKVTKGNVTSYSDVRPRNSNTSNDIAELVKVNTPPPSPPVTNDEQQEQHPRENVSSNSDDSSNNSNEIDETVEEMQVSTGTSGSTTPKNSICKVPNIGVNSDSLLYYSAEMPLKDLAKTSMGWIRPWGSKLENVKLDLDSDGYLKTVDGGGAQTIISDDNWGRSADDNKYVVLYDGEGKLSFNLNETKIIKQSSGRIEIKLGKGRTGMSQSSTNPANYLRNIRIVPLEDEDTYQEVITREKFRNVWQGTGVIRYLNAQRTNNSKEVEWSERQRATTFGSGKGQSLEDIIEMSNEMNVSPWLLAPHLANDDYFRKMAMYVRDNLNPNLKVYIEYTNEAWNWGFQQTHYLDRLTKKNGTTLYQEYGQRAKQLFEIWRDVFGGNGRLVRVIGTQHHNPWISEQIMKTQGLSDLVDALAVGYYVGHEFSGTMAQAVLDMSEDEIFNHLETKSLPEAKALLIRQKRVADEYGLDLIAYEAGQHLVAGAEWRENKVLVDKLISLNKNPKMTQLYMNMYRDWKEVGGGLIVWFQTAGLPSKWGSWGLLENTGQTIQNAPKYRAYKEMLSNNGC